MDVVNRTFVGILVPDAVSSEIERQMLLLKRKSGVENVRWNARSEYLIQLASLGELGPSTLATFKSILPPRVARFPPFQLEVKGFGGSPNLVQPRFAVAELQGDTAYLQQIADSVEGAIAPYLPQRDMKGFRPHIILGRLKTESEPLRVGLGRALKMNQAPPMGTIEVDSIALLISHATEFGINYQVVERMPLGQ
jgi:2'-5' RNA ligase